MDSHTRALIAAVTFVAITGKKAGGLHDHTARRDWRIAAERKDDRIQGFDGDRAAKFGGTLPEIYDEGDKSFISFEIEGAKVQGYDRGSQCAFSANVSDGLVQVYDSSAGAWFAYDVQDPDSAQSYHRGSRQGG